MMALLATAAAGLVPAALEAAPLPDAALRFGMRPRIESASLSPDGTQVAFITPTQGQGSAGVHMPVSKGSKPQIFVMASGKPERLSSCNWVSANRFVCRIYGVSKSNVDGQLLPYTRLLAVGQDGKDMKLLSSKDNLNSTVYNLNGGSVVDWLPDEDDQILMQRAFLGDYEQQRDAGIRVDRIDTRTMKIDRVEPVRKDSNEYISDGRGNIRIMGVAHMASSRQLTGITSYKFRRKGSEAWEDLSQFDSQTGEGFNPYAVDAELDVAYGFEKTNGRYALWKVKLDGSAARTLVLDHANVDIDELIRIGRRNRVVGASYVTDKREPVYFDPEIKSVMASLSKALPTQPLIRVVQASTDERKLIVWAGADNDPGLYYFFDRDKRTLDILTPARPELEGVKLATVKPVSYPAADGTMIPGYLTLPPEGTGKNLPAIVLPHGGPSARDEWGFDWLSQYFAHQGYAVLQPNFRGSAGYGDAWFQENGFKSWKTAIGDVSDAGRWLIKEGIADPKRLGIVGWSYGGYAALQSAAIDPGLYRAVVAIAPVTNLSNLKAEWKGWSNYRLQANFIGSGPHIKEGSPAENAGAIVAPVMLVHGDMDRNVNIDQSELMESRLKKAGKAPKFLRFEGLDHNLQDSAAREQMLRESDEWLKAAFK